LTAFAIERSNIMLSKLKFKKHQTENEIAHKTRTVNLKENT